MAKEIPVPEELKILLPELNKATIVVGAKAYEMFPLVEGQLERIISEIGAIMEKINSPDGQCSKCGKVVKNARPLKIFNCDDDGAPLLSVVASPIEALMGSSKIPEWVSMITALPPEEIKANMTLNQIKHFAGVFWKQNFTDEGLPAESLENFRGLLRKFGPEKQMEQRKEETPSAENTEANQAQQ
jgi:hypothetical protein